VKFQEDIGNKLSDIGLDNDFFFFLDLTPKVQITFEILMAGNGLLLHP
jgi:hypothetical protein